MSSVPVNSILRDKGPRKVSSIWSPATTAVGRIMLQKLTKFHCQRQYTTIPMRRLIALVFWKLMIFNLNLLMVSLYTFIFLRTVVFSLNSNYFIWCLLPLHIHREKSYCPSLLILVGQTSQVSLIFPI